MVKLKHVKKAHKRLIKSKPKNIDTCNINYEYTFDCYRSGKYMHAILNTANPTNHPALIMHELKQNKVKKAYKVSTQYKTVPVQISLTNNKIVVNNDSLSVKEMERAVYGYVSKNKNVSLKYKYWITAKYININEPLL